MIIKRMRIHNYRSFEEIEFELFPYTVVVGPNNIGKSNILRAIELFFETRTAFKTASGTFHPLANARLRKRTNYEFTRDFPVNAQKHRGKKITRITLLIEIESRDFSLYKLDAKFRTFRNINATLQLYESKEVVNIKFWCDKLSQNEAYEFHNWVLQQCHFIRVPSNRASEASEQLLRGFSYRIFANLQGSYKVKRNLDSLARRAKEEISQAEREILVKLQTFIPELKCLNFQLKELPGIPDIFGISDIKIDDGTLTSLASKGDGIQSLFFIGFLQHITMDCTPEVGHKRLG
jgi:predicted ATP-dependent endonuclease of OLD family